MIHHKFSYLKQKKETETQTNFYERLKFKFFRYSIFIRQLTNFYRIIYSYFVVIQKQITVDP